MPVRRLKVRGTTVIFAALVAMLIVGCNTEDPMVGGHVNNVNNVNNDGLTKEEAAATNGEDADGNDLCEREGWYGDGECDDFCPEVDKDCLTTCADSSECLDGQICEDSTCVDAKPGCGGADAVECERGEYCNFEDACPTPEGTGMCETMPLGCDDSFVPVCGCDDVTYGNACEAAAAGVSVASEGECADECQDDTACQNGEVCVNGGCVADVGCTGGADACAADEYCAFTLDQACGDGDVAGICAPRPMACTKEYKPVCGCDGNVYDNACLATKAGTSRAPDDSCELPCLDNAACGDGATCVDGSCVADTGRCGGRGGAMCGPGEYCFYTVTDICGQADALGTCQPVPALCSREVDPVCGCDGNDYTNACLAAAAQISVASRGACPKACTANDACGIGESCVAGYCEPNTQCGGIQGLSCAASDWCDYPDTATCGQGDFFGTCNPRPVFCPQNLDPVCGCDNMTYENDCFAKKAGVDVMSDGVCPP